ncbi:tRNA (guanine-N(1)-)-methyltransferase [Phycisphaerae bacterium]|nr:tRNA (guanine-N(1)-)-methyltransferase [Phycisphaerae bacterium]
MRIDILTTFPELFSTTSPAVLGVSIPARAIKANILSVHATDIRAFTHDKHSKTDDRPFGGGPGMVMMCQPVWDAVLAAEAQDQRPATRILLTPQGTPLTQKIVEDLATKPRLLMLAGHYEGIDERVIEALDPIEISIGDYVLSGGELAALVLIDAITRLLPGATGDQLSPQQDSFGNVTIPPQSNKHQPTTQRLLDCPHYTKPRDWQGREVPPVLLSGDHTKIAAWRLQQRMQRTFVRRPDLLDE